MAAAERWETTRDSWAPVCAIHADVTADRVCQQCALFACGDCALVRSIRDKQYEACPSCRGILVAVRGRSPAGSLPLPELDVPPVASHASPFASHASPFVSHATPVMSQAARGGLELELETRPSSAFAPTSAPLWQHPAPETSDVQRVEGGSVEAHVERSATLFALLPSALAYPLQGPGIFVIITGTIFSWFVAFLSRAPLMGIIAAIFGAGYLAAYTLKVIESSAHGEKRLAAFPDFTDFWEDLLCPLFRVIAASFVSFVVPCGIAGLLVVRFGANPLVLVAAAGAGLLYFPMALVAVSVRRTFFAASPHIVLRMIVAAPLEYAIACAIVAALIAIRVVVHIAFAVVLPILGFFIGDFIAFYLLLVELRVLGLIYHVSRDRLDWLEAA